MVADAAGMRGDFVLDATRPGLNAPPAAHVTRTAAVAVAERAVGSGRTRVPTTAGLAILPQRGRNRLVWRVSVSRDAPTGSFEVLVDARTGDIAL